jgi:hypothetical protein
MSYGFIPGCEKSIYIRGGFSLDWWHPKRIEGVTLWAEKEELSYVELGDFVEWFENECQEVDTIVSHVTASRWNEYFYGCKLQREVLNPSPTEKALERMFEIADERKQKLTNYFGHHHRSTDFRMGLHRFICLAEGEEMNVELE